MEEILHHLGCIKPYKYWDELPTGIKWCRVSSINSLIYLATLLRFLKLLDFTSNILNLPAETPSDRFLMNHGVDSRKDVENLPKYVIEVVENHQIMH